MKSVPFGCFAGGENGPHIELGSSPWEEMGPGSYLERNFMGDKIFKWEGALVSYCIQDQENYPGISMSPRFTVLNWRCDHKNKVDTFSEIVSDYTLLDVGKDDSGAREPWPRALILSYN